MEIPISGNFVRICHFWKNRSCTSDRKMSMADPGKSKIGRSWKKCQIMENLPKKGNSPGVS